MSELRRAVETAVDQALAEYVVREVIRLYQARPLSCAVLFSGNDRNLDPLLGQLAALEPGLFEIKGVLGHLDRFFPDRAAIEKALGKAPASFAEEAECLLVPDLSLDAAAKIAHGIRDARIPLLVSEALLRGKTVLACADGARAGARDANGAYGRMLRDNLERLRSYGIRLIKRDEAGESLQRLRQELRAPGGQRAVTDFCPDRLLTRQSLSGFKPGCALNVRADAVLTPLAADYARERSIRLVKES